MPRKDVTCKISLTPYNERDFLKHFRSLHSVSLEFLLVTLLLPILLVVANVTGAGMIVPQIMRIRRLRSIDGVSLPWVGVGIGLNIWWTLYSVQAELWGLLPVSLVSLLFYAIIGGQSLRIKGPHLIPQFAKGLVVTGGVPLLVLLTFGWTAAGLAIGLGYSVQFAPAAVEAIRARNLDGLSSATWILALIEAFIWTFYGIVERDAPLIVGGTGGALMSIIILSRLQHARPWGLTPSVISDRRKSAGATRATLKNRA